MKKPIFKYLLFAFLIVVIGLLLPKCKEELPTGGGYYPVDHDPANAPSITSIDPDTAYPGKTITVNGALFNPDLDLNRVSIGNSLITADSVSSNATTLWFTSPEGYTDVTVDVKVSSVPSPYWSNAVSFYYPAYRLIFMITITPSQAILDDPTRAYIYRTLGDWSNNDPPYQEVVPVECADWWGNHRGYVIPSQDTVFTDVWQSCETFDFGFFTGLETPNPYPDSIDMTFAVDMAFQDTSRGVYITGNITGWSIDTMHFVPLVR